MRDEPCWKRVIEREEANVAIVILGYLGLEGEWSSCCLGYLRLKLVI